MNKTTELAGFCDIRFGINALPQPDGTAVYLQVRQFDDQGGLVAREPEYIDLEGMAATNILGPGDVLFVGKGSRLFAWRFQPFDRPAVASSSFFILRITSQEVDPDYLTAILNAPQVRTAIQSIGAGSNIFSIRKSELGAFQIPLPSLPQQKHIALLAQLHRWELDLAQKLIVKKQNLYSSIISNLIK